MSFDISESRQLVIDYLQQTQKEITDQIISKKMNASGRTIASLNVQPTLKGATLFGAAHFITLEDGRPPGQSDPYQNGRPLIDIIKQWILDKGLDLNPYAVTKNIQLKGTKLYRAGGKSGVLSIPLNPIKINDLFKEVIEQITQSVSSEIYSPINFAKYVA